VAVHFHFFPKTNGGRNHCHGFLNSLPPIIDGTKLAKIMNGINADLIFAYFWIWKMIL